MISALPNWLARWGALLALGLALGDRPGPAGAVFIHIDDRGRMSTRRAGAGRRWHRPIALLLFGLAGWQITEGLWIPAKAALAQLLIARAWATAVETGAAPAPWPWADTFPVARLTAPEQGADQIVLAHATGRTLSFGPGHLDGSARPGEDGLSIMSGHRDTSFAFLADLKTGDPLRLQGSDGQWRDYRVSAIEIIDERTTRLPRRTTGPSQLLLTTCYPFDAVLPGGPLRYLVWAEQAGPAAP